MRTTTIILSTVVAAGAIGGIALSAQAGARSGSDPHATHQPTGRYTFVEHARTDTVVDLGARGDSRGDLLAFANPVFDARNTHRVGSDEGSCVRTAPGRSWECEWTLRLPDGHLVVQGPFFDRHDSVLAITGGTGTWRQARGQMVLHARNAAGTSFDFRYHVTR